MLFYPLDLEGKKRSSGASRTGILTWNPTCLE